MTNTGPNRQKDLEELGSRMGKAISDRIQEFFMI